MLVSEILAVAISDTGTDKVLSRTACKRLRNGDMIGYHFTGTGGAGYWVPAKVIANDTRDGILAVQMGHHPVETFWYSEGDDIIAWPTTTDRTN